LIWTIRVFKVLYNHCTLDQILVHFANIHPPYRNWVFFNGYRRGELSSAPDLVANTVLPDRDHINWQAFGEADPPRSAWDDYNIYRGAQPQGKAKASVFVQNTEPPSAAEHNSTLGTDPAVRRDLSTSEETHTPSPRGPPKAKARPKEQPKKTPKEPDHPPSWAPSLRPVDHQVGPKVTQSVVSVPPPRVAGGAAEERPKPEGPKQPSEPKASGEASVHRDFHQTLGPPPQRPPRAATPRGDRTATAIPPPPAHPPPTAADLDRTERGRPRERAGTVPTARTGGDHADKSPAASAPAAPKPVSRSRSRVPATLIPRADGTFADQDTEVLRRARGGNLGTPSLIPDH